MQNSQPYPGFPRKARIAPRRARRGALMPAAVLAVLVITIVMSQFAQAQLRRASAARSEARAVWLAAIAADFDYYVHDKSHPEKSHPEEKEQPWPAAGFTGLRGLNDTEETTFKDDFLRVGLAPKMPGVTVDYLILRGPEDDDVFGALRLSALDGRSRAQICAVIARLARHGARPAVPSAPQSTSPEPTKPRQARTCDASISQRVILTAPLSGINPKYVLRMRRAGHPPPKLLGGGALDMDGHNLSVKNLTALGGAESSAETVAVPRLDAREMTGTLVSVGKTPDARSDDAAAPPPKTTTVDIAGTTHVAKTFTVTQMLSAGGLTGLPPDSTTGKRGESALKVERVIIAGDWVKTDTLTTTALDAQSHLTTQSMTLTPGQDSTIETVATVSGTLTADTLNSPAVTVSKNFTASQVFTKSAVIEKLEIKGECARC